jgi:DNA-binding transcriptional LysR family regulator
MNESQVETFLMVAHTGSMSRAAEQLFITQPAIKKQLDSLEAELGAQLFERTKRGCVLTETGRMFARGIAPLADELSALKAEVARTASGGQCVALCVLPGLVSPRFGEICASFTERNPKIQVNFVRMQYTERPRMVSLGRADVGVYFQIPGILDPLGLSFWHIPRKAASPCVCLVSDSSPLKNHERLQVPDLIGIPLATFDPAPIGPTIDLIERQSGIHPDLKVLSSDGYNIIEFCNSGGAFLAHHVSADIMGLHVIPLDTEMPPEGFITRRNPSPATREFLRVAEDLLDGMQTASS